jgi:DNA polymerase-3 subunit chi
MGLALFYHLTRSPVEQTVPQILGRALGQNLRVHVRGRAADRMDWLDQRLWLEGEASFLPHGVKGGPHDDLQPVLLCTDATVPPDGTCLMAIDGAEVRPADCVGRDRVWILFDGNDPAALDIARQQWKTLTDAGVSAQYWSEESGRWQKKTEK